VSPQVGVAGAGRRRRPCGSPPARVRGPPLLLRRDPDLLADLHRRAVVVASDRDEGS